MTEVVAILTTINDRNATIRTVNFHMTHPATLQDAAITTSVATEEADSIVVVEGRIILILVKTPAAPKTTIVVKGIEEGIGAIVKVPIAEEETMEAMEVATKMFNRNHVQA